MSSQPPSTEPPWSGWIETTGDALLILEAARRGLIPRVTRRLVDTERKMITSGSVFVFDEKESGIKRWTDGFFWSPSRILGNFLLYRETDKRGPGHRGRGDGDDIPSSPPNHSVGGQTLSRPRSDSSSLNIDKVRERSLMGSLTNSYKFKTDGLMKKTFSLNIDGVAQHLISYYRIEDVQSGRLRSPSTLPELASLDISPELLDKTHFRNPPKVEVGPDGIPRYRGEADEIDQQPALLPGPLSTGLPLLTDGRYAGDKQAVKRYDPYGAPSNTKRLRRTGKSPDEPSTSGSASALVIPPVQPSIQQQPLQTYSDANVPMGQAQSQQVQHPATGHPPPSYPSYGMPSSGYYPYHGGPPMYPTPYMHPGGNGSPVSGVPPSAHSTPSPVPSPTSSTTPTPSTSNAMQGVQATTAQSTHPTAVGGTQQQQSPAVAAPPAMHYPYPYPYPQQHHAHMGQVPGAQNATGPVPANTSPTDLNPNANAASVAQQSQSSQMQPPHPGHYYPYYPPYPHPYPGWSYGYMHGQQQPQSQQMPAHMQQPQQPQGQVQQQQSTSTVQGSVSVPVTVPTRTTTTTEAQVAVASSVDQQQRQAGVVERGGNSSSGEEEAMSAEET
ncbi:hypothetical protein K435DRAFT_72170 [Dendrothele bispora CBS 962.96]|uniref:Uncharacterized protein n=1 Tax=Dendrothele bispora (strain CBS 962.96) TaxID=1314807 RepID=A0A4S8KQE5_DENBC|nr:hypothetical protein K435DRAFT_72170 [Dendrothele bispora CBS 962.96]